MAEFTHLLELSAPLCISNRGLNELPRYCLVCPALCGALVSGGLNGQSSSVTSTPYNDCGLGQALQFKCTKEATSPMHPQLVEVIAFCKKTCDV